MRKLVLVVVLAVSGLGAGCAADPVGPRPCTPQTATVVDTVRNAAGQVVMLVSYCGGAAPAR